MTNVKREYPCEDWWWIDPEKGGPPYELENRTTRAIEKSIESYKFAMTIYDKGSEDYNLCLKDLERNLKELEDRKINPREGDIF